MPDATQNSLALFNDPSKWIVVRDVPIFREHVSTLPDGKPFPITKEELVKFASELQRLEEVEGVMTRLTIGHTLSKNPQTGAEPKETDQPPIVGFGRNAHVGLYGKSQKPAILHDHWVLREQWDEYKKYPYRSPEVYLSSRQITGVALLKRDPKLDMGMTIFQNEHAPAVSLSQPKAYYQRTDGLQFYAMDDEATHYGFGGALVGGVAGDFLGTMGGRIGGAALGGLAGLPFGKPALGASIGSGIGAAGGGGTGLIMGAIKGHKVQKELNQLRAAQVASSAPTKMSSDMAKGAVGGSIGGALSGALIGGVTGRPGLGAAVGAGLGGIGGAGAGALRQSIVGNPSKMSDSSSPQGSSPAVDIDAVLQECLASLYGREGERSDYLGLAGGAALLGTGMDLGQGRSLTNSVARNAGGLGGSLAGAAAGSSWGLPGTVIGGIAGGIGGQKLGDKLTNNADPSAPQGSTPAVDIDAVLQECLASLYSRSGQHSNYGFVDTIGSKIGSGLSSLGSKAAGAGYAGVGKTLGDWGTAAANNASTTGGIALGAGGLAAGRLTSNSCSGMPKKMADYASPQGAQPACECGQTPCQCGSVDIDSVLQQCIASLRA